MKILKFGAAWCTPCKQLGLIIESIGLSDKIESVDVDKNPELAKQYKIRSVPTLVKLNDDGNEISRKSGNMNKTELLKYYGDQE